MSITNFMLMIRKTMVAVLLTVSMVLLIGTISPSTVNVIVIEVSEGTVDGVNGQFVAFQHVVTNEVTRAFLQNGNFSSGNTYRLPASMIGMERHDPYPDILIVLLELVIVLMFFHAAIYLVSDKE